MIIKYIKLVNFRRMPLRDIEVFEHTFNSKITIITGPNGCGKSSLFNELTPLPSDKNNFNKNGYKEIHIEKNNNLFKLISDFREGTKYYFYLNDENLNISNNVTTQKELVYKYFNITTNIHEILIGNEVFTDMSLLNRKKLFNSITHLNIDKVIENYNILKEELKNNEFLLKTQTSLKQAEEEKLINKDHLDNLLNNQSHIKEYIDTLLSIRNDIYRYKDNSNLDSVYSTYKELLNKYKLVIEKYYTYLTSYPTDEINKYNAKLEIINFKLNTLYSNLEKKQEEISILNLNKEQNIETLNNQLNSYIEYKNKLIDSLSIYKNIEIDITNVKNDIYKLEVSLPDIIRTIPLNTNKKYSKEKYEQLLTLKNNSLSELNSIVSKEIELNKEVEHLKLHRKDIVCPSCSYKWSLTDTDTKIENINNEIQTLLERKIRIQKDIENIDKDITEITEYFNIYRQYSTIRNATYHTLKCFWEIVDTNQYIFLSPESISPILKTLINDIVTIEEIKDISKKYEELSKNIEVLNTLKDTNLDKLNKDILDLNDEIYSLQLEKAEIHNHIQNNQIAINATNTLNKIKIALERSIDDLYSSNISYTISEVLNVIESELSKNKIALIEIEKEINNYNNIKYTLDKYNNQIEDIKSNIKILTIILDELSPKNGLIAKSISSFLNIIINNINSIINSIWEYRMILKAINIEEETLNYKFKVEVEDKLVISDIVNCSAGMKKVINFSFVMLLYKLLNIEGYPLYLDEFTTNLDVSHSQKFAQLINQLSITDKHSQIFVISHISNDMYFSNKSLDVIELGH